jgi:hypothetical protein
VAGVPERRRRRVVGEREAPPEAGERAPRARTGNGSAPGPAPTHRPTEPSSSPSHRRGDPAAGPDQTWSGAELDAATAERGLRGLVGGGSSQVSPGAAMRARDAARPSPEELARVDAELRIVRRNWTPRD